MNTRSSAAVQLPTFDATLAARQPQPINHLNAASEVALCSNRRVRTQLFSCETARGRCSVEAEGVGRDEPEMVALCVDVFA